MIQKLLNKPLLLSPGGLEAINAVDWLAADSNIVFKMGLRLFQFMGY